MNGENRSKNVIGKIIIAVILSFGIGFFVGMEYKAYELRKAFSDFGKEIKNISVDDQKKEEIKDTSKQKDETKIIEKNIGDEVGLATIKVKVNKSEEKNIISGSDKPTVAKEGAKFLVINADITNTTSDPFDFDSDGIVVTDDKGRSFKDYSDVFFAVDDYMEQRTLQPSIAEKGSLVYEIASDAEHYGLSIKKGGTNEEYRIILK